MNTQYLETQTGKIAYQKYDANSESGILFMTGLASSMVGSKSEILREFCQERKISFTRFDYFGHGQSEGEFLEGNISIWTQNATDIMQKVIQKPQIIIGSSMSGWMMFFLAERFPEKVKGLIGVAAAPDFTEDVYKMLSNSKTMRDTLDNEGYIPIQRGEDNILLMSKSLLVDGKNNAILQREVKIECPLVLLHGFADDIVHYHKLIELTQVVNTEDVEVRLIKNADHGMKDPKSIKALLSSIEAML